MNSTLAGVGNCLLARSWKFSEAEHREKVFWYCGITASSGVIFANFFAFLKWLNGGNESEASRKQALPFPHINLLKSKIVEFQQDNFGNGLSPKGLFHPIPPLFGVKWRALGNELFCIEFILHDLPTAGREWHFAHLWAASAEYNRMWCSNP